MEHISNIGPAYKRYRKGRRTGRSQRYWMVKLLLPLVAIVGVGIFRNFDTSALLAETKTSLPAASVGEMITGRASVIDGDTVEINGKRIRFDGIDAPEAAQHCSDQKNMPVRCGARSAEALAAYLAKSQPTRCSIIGTDQYGRFIGTCKRQDGRDISEWMVRSGHALDWPRLSGGR